MRHPLRQTFRIYTMKVEQLLNVCVAAQPFAVGHNAAGKISADAADKTERGSVGRVKFNNRFTEIVAGKRCVSLLCSGNIGRFWYWWGAGLPCSSCIFFNR